MEKSLVERAKSFSKNLALTAGLGTALAVSSGCVPVGRGDYAGFGTNAFEGARFLNDVEANNIQRDRNQAYANNQGGQNSGQVGNSASLECYIECEGINGRLRLADLPNVSLFRENEIKIIVKNGLKGADNLEVDVMKGEQLLGYGRFKIQEDKVNWVYPTTFPKNRFSEGDYDVYVKVNEQIREISKLHLRSKK